MDEDRMSGGAGGGGRGMARRSAEQLEDLEPEGYAEWFEALKRRVRSARFRAARAANTEMLRLYWSTGRDILVRQRDDGWGAKVIDRIARDMRREFPEQRGWSRTNLYSMRKAAEVWPTEEEFVQRDVGQLPWGHIVTLLDRLDTLEDRDWYAARALAEGWKRGVLEHFIRAGLKRQIGSAPTNFGAALEDPDYGLVVERDLDRRAVVRI